MNATGAVGSNLGRRVVKIIGMDSDRICKGGKTRRRPKIGAEDCRAATGNSLAGKMIAGNPRSVRDRTGEREPERIEYMNFGALDHRSRDFGERYRTCEIGDRRSYIPGHYSLPLPRRANILVCPTPQQPQMNRGNRELF